MKYIKDKLESNNVYERIITLLVIFLITFIGVTILSYYLLPEGFLLNKSKLTDFETSTNLIVCTIQIFFFNMISVVFILIGSLFAKKKTNEHNYRSYAYSCFLIFIIINAITLGTWSFSVNMGSVPLIDRVIRTFDVVHNAGLIEMLG